MDNKKESIKISLTLKTFLYDRCTEKGETYEDIIWRLIGKENPLKDQKRNIKFDYKKL